jgi:uncharacterized protein (DUF488 family)
MLADAPQSHTLWSIGHSNHPFDRFVDLLRQHRIEVLVDVRTAPYSKYAPHFAREAMAAALPRAGIRYIFLGRELGGRPSDERYRGPDGRVLYGELAMSDLFRAGVDRLEQGLSQYRYAIMCSEENPCICHRHGLVSRAMRGRAVEIRHIRGDGRCETFDEVERQVSTPERPEETLWSV